MRDIYRLSVVLAVIGLGLMSVAAVKMQPEEMSADDIDESMVGKPVKLNGTIHDYYTDDETEFFELHDETGSIKVVNFDPRQRKGLGHPITVTGEVSLYKGELEVVAREIDY
ncbi:MAG: hypothetical protein ABEJ69_03355 [Candidatus Nanohaloarchaea archaeon]